MENIRKFYGKTIIDSRDSDELDLGYQMELKYYKTMNSLVVSDQSKKFGIEVVKKEMDGKNVTIESEHMNDLTNLEENVDKILNVLVKNKVTPIGVKDVMVDLMKVNNSARLF